MIQSESMRAESLRMRRTCWSTKVAEEKEGLFVGEYLWGLLVLYSELCNISHVCSPHLDDRVFMSAMRSRIIRLLTRPPRLLFPPASARFPLRAALPRPQLTPLHSPLRRWSSSEAPLPDPSRPDLFYHLLPLPLEPDPSQSIPVYALSFLPAPPPSPRSATVLGWLPAVTDTATEDVGAGLNDFVENRAYMTPMYINNVSYQHASSARFRPLLHQALQQALREGADDIWINSAIQLQQGWMHIHGMLQGRMTSSVDLDNYVDSRNVPALGRIGDPDDIIASVLVEDSKVRSFIAAHDAISP